MARARKHNKCAFYKTCGNLASAIVCGGYHVCSSCQKEMEDADDVDDGYKAEAPPAPAPTKKDNEWTCSLCGKTASRDECVDHFRQHYQDTGFI
jgi:hypothetical protein